MDTRYYRKNRRKYCLKVHIVLVSKYRRRIFTDEMGYLLKEICRFIAKGHQWEILAMETDGDHLHMLMEYDTTECVADIVKIIKQQTTYYFWQRYSEVLSHYYWQKRILWSDGYFACSIGEVSAATIRQYIESQG